MGPSAQNVIYIFETKSLITECEINVKRNDFGDYIQFGWMWKSIFNWLCVPFGIEFGLGVEAKLAKRCFVDGGDNV